MVVLRVDVEIRIAGGVVHSERVVAEHVLQPGYALHAGRVGFRDGAVYFGLVLRRIRLCGLNGLRVRRLGRFIRNGGAGGGGGRRNLRRIDLISACCRRLRRRLGLGSLGRIGMPGLDLFFGADRLSAARQLDREDHGSAESSVRWILFRLVFISRFLLIGIV